MGLILTYGARTFSPDSEDHASIASEARLNQLALEYGYKYRLDISGRKSLSRIEFVRKISEARFIGRPVRRAGHKVRFFKINQDGTLKPYQW
jgi:hypothetical protein